MIPGTGPGRGVPWWRLVLDVVLRNDPGVAECDPARRPGRLVRKVPPR